MEYQVEVNHRLVLWDLKFQKRLPQLFSSLKNGRFLVFHESGMERHARLLNYL